MKPKKKSSNPSQCLKETQYARAQRMAASDGGRNVGRAKVWPGCPTAKQKRAAVRKELKKDELEN